MKERAFEYLEGPAKGKVMRLTHDEFNLIFASAHPSVARKALAWCGFVFMGERMIQVPCDN